MTAESQLAVALREMDQKLTVPLSEPSKPEPEPEKPYSTPQLHIPVPKKQQNEITINPESADKTQWHKVLNEFCGLSDFRKQAALKRLKVTQLDDLINLCQEAKEYAEEAILEHYLEKMAAEGISLEKLVEFKSTQKEKKPLRMTIKQGQKSPKEVHEYIRDTYRTVEAGDQLVYIKKEFDVEMNKQTLYSLRYKFKKEDDKKAKKNSGQ